MGSMTMNIRIGRQVWSHHHVTKKGKLVVEPYVRGYDMFYSARDVDEPDWKTINQVLERDYNASNVEMRVYIRIDTTNNTS
jgi:hypothetical protein